MLKVLINAYNDSFLNRIIVSFGNAYSNSGIKKLAGTVSHWGAESACGTALKRYSNKRPNYGHSFYQKTLTWKSGIVSVLTLSLKGFLGRITAGSRFCKAYSIFLANKTENKLRAAGIFGFYFFLTATALSVFGITYAGNAAVYFAAAIVSLVFTLTVAKLSAFLKHSFFAKLFLELIK